MNCTPHERARTYGSGAAGDGSPLDTVETAFQLLAAGPQPLALDLAGLGHDLLSRIVPVTELRTLLLRGGLPRTAQDAAWRELVRRARTGEPAWTIACAGMALPGMRRIAAGLARSYDGDRDDIDAEVLAGFLAALTSIDLAWTRIAFRLLTRARRAGHRARRTNRPLGRPLTESDQPAHRPQPGHPDQVLNAAVQRGVLTAAEAELIGETRIGGAQMRDLAARYGVAYTTLLQRRRRAERRLAVALGRGDLIGSTSLATVRPAGDDEPGVSAHPAAA